MIVWREDRDYLKAQSGGNHHNHSGKKERKFKTQNGSMNEKEGMKDLGR